MDRRKALIFDMDGTMFDTEPIFYRFGERYRPGTAMIWIERSMIRWQVVTM